jgi:hypothetical protein
VRRSPGEGAGLVAGRRRGLDTGGGAGGGAGRCLHSQKTATARTRERAAKNIVAAENRRGRRGNAG